MLITLLLLSPFILSDAFFTQITDAIHLGDDVYVITTQSGDYHAHLYDAANDELLNSIVRHGAGPEEARGVVNIADCGDDTLVMISPEGRILHYTHDLDFISEHQTIYISTNSLHCDNGTLTIGYRSFFRSDQLETDEKFIVGASMNLDSISDVTEIRLRGSDLYLGPDIRFNNLPLLMIEFYVAQTSSDTHLIAIKGSPILYLKSEELMTYKFTNDILSEIGFVESREGEYYAQRAGAVNSNWQLFNDEDVTTHRFYFGADNIYTTDSEVVPFGHLDVTVDENNLIDLDYIFYPNPIKEDLSELEYRYTTVEGTNTTLLFRAYTMSANYVYVTGKFDF